MKITTVHPRELGSAEVELWARIQQADPVLASPCLSPHFVRAAAILRDDIFVGVIEEGNRLTGFFPFQCNEAGEALPAKKRMADYEAIIVPRDTEWNLRELLRGCGLTRWSYGTLVGSDEQFRASTTTTSCSPVIDLSRGFETWMATLHRPGSRLRKHLQSQRRTLERDWGELRFEAHAAGNEAMRWLHDYKSAQYRRTGMTDHFQTAWVAAMVECIHHSRDQFFRGTLSLLHAGDRIVAAHFGMQSPTVWHYWLPCYDRALAKYSPGLLLLIEMARHAEMAGIRHIDLGSGTESYKSRLANGRVSTAAGVVALDSSAQCVLQPSTAASHSPSPILCAST